jgi:hypothetical protein
MFQHNPKGKLHNKSNGELNNKIPFEITQLAVQNYFLLQKQK